MKSNIPTWIRKRVYRREGWRCALCDSTEYLQIHHIIPRGRGGSNHEINLICLCADCHAATHALSGAAAQEDAEQAIVEYMADYYASNQGAIWSPYRLRPIWP
jgi:5-methylcytosine-specific restriction endonuclease McrA